MKITLNRDKFIGGLQLVGGVVAAKSTMPIFGNVLLEAEGDGLSLAASNRDVIVRCRIPAVVAENGAITLPAKRLAGIIRGLPAETVEIETDKSMAGITAGAASHRISGIAPDEFPAMDQAQIARGMTFSIMQDELAEMLRSVSFAQSDDASRYILNGVYFDGADGDLRLVASDGRQLASAKKDGAVQAGFACGAIVPCRAVKEIQRVLGHGEKVEVTLGQGRAVFRFGTEKARDDLTGEITIWTTLVDGNYPNYRQVLPKETPNVFEAEREPLLECVRRAALLCPPWNPRVKVKVSRNTMEISASSGEVGESHETLDIPYAGPEMEAAFNPGYLTGVLQAFQGEKVALDMRDAVSPAVIRSGDRFICVVLPTRCLGKP